jgi:hypothetical protein
MKQGTIISLKLTVFIIGVIIFVLCAYGLPMLSRVSSEMNPEFAYLKLPVLLGLYVTALPFFLALYQALRLLKYIESEKAFSELSVIALGNIKNCAIIIFTLYLIGMFFLLSQNALHPGIAIIGLVISFASLVISLFTGVLQELLKNAINIKSENDLTV